MIQKTLDRGPPGGASRTEAAVMGGAVRGPIRLESPAITAADCTRTDAPPVAECWVGIDVAKAHSGRGDLADSVERLRVDPR
jgi:hypothetical protein